MKIVLVSDDDVFGGAAIAATRLCSELRGLGKEVARAVACKKSIDRRTFLPMSRAFLRGVEIDVIRRMGLDGLARRKERKETLRGMARRVRVLSPDVVNVHNIHRIADGPWLIDWLAGKWPVVWTLHDMWAFTGHCAYAFDCEKFVEGCDRACPAPEAYSPMKPGGIRKSWLLRRKILEENPHICAITPSRWLAGEAKRGLWRDHRVEVVPNGLDLGIFKPFDRGKAREALGIDPAGRYVLFSAYALKEPRKGGPLLIESLRRLRLENVRLLTYGPGELGSGEKEPSFPVVPLGEVKDERTMRLAYSAADVFALPTLADNLPNVLMEAMACGTPSVAFDVGGVPEMVRHMETGYLARHKDVDDFTTGLYTLLADDALREKLGRRSVEVVKAEYAVELMAERYLAVFSEVAAEFKKNHARSSG